MKPDNKIISREELRKFLDRLAHEQIVMAPTKQQARVTFNKISSSDEIYWDSVNTREAPKKLFFPRSEKLFGYTGEQDHIKVTAPDLDRQPMLLFGARPCDISSFAMLDRIFIDGKFRDHYYAKRRENTVVIGRGCRSACSTCFCGTFGIDMMDGAGSDIFLIDLDDNKFLAEILTEKGQKLIAGAGEFKTASDSDTAAAEKARKAAGPSPEFTVDLEKVKTNLDHAFEHEMWDKVHERCLGCGICTYLCPTCHCFDVSDEKKFNRGERIRTWDSCMYSLFTLHVSGHNPRPTQMQRWRQRLMHKFNYGPHRTGDYLCVGCGRCVAHCPVNIDIKQLLKTAEQAEIKVESAT